MSKNINLTPNIPRKFLNKTLIKNEDIIITGFLWKRGKINTAYKERFCVLVKTGILLYYRLSSEIPRGEISLLNYRILNGEKTDFGRNYSFSLIPHLKSGRQWFFAAKNATESSNWIELLTAGIENITSPRSPKTKKEFTPIPVSPKENQLGSSRNNTNNNNANTFTANDFKKEQVRGNCEIVESNLTFGEKVSKTPFGDVFSGKYNDLLVIMKEVDKKDSSTYSERIEVAKDLNFLNHPNLLHTIGFHTSSSDVLYFIEEYSHSYTPLAHPTLLSLLRENQTQIYKVSTQICSGMLFLHTNNIIHGDLNLENVRIVDLESFSVKINGAGLINAKSKDKCNPIYTAPEFYFDGDYSPKMDVFSFGITLIEVISGKLWPDSTNAEKIQNSYRKDALPKVPIPQAISRLIFQCTSSNVNDRPLFETCMLESQSLSKNLTVSVKKTEYSGFSPSELQYQNFDKPIADLFEKKNLIPWDDFEKEILKFPIVSDGALEVLKNILEKGGFIERSQWILFTNWLSPWKSQGLEHTLSEVLDILLHSFFYGFITPQEAESLLEGKESGSYLLRLSSSSPGCYVISTSYYEGQCHWKVSVESYPNVHFKMIEGHSFQSFADLLEFHKREPLPTLYPKLKNITLKYPCDNKVDLIK